jgi:hypothetical protein
MVIERPERPALAPFGRAGRKFLAGQGPHIMML